LALKGGGGFSQKGAGKGDAHGEKHDKDKAGDDEDGLDMACEDAAGLIAADALIAYEQASAVSQRSGTESDTQGGTTEVDAEETGGDCSNMSVGAVGGAGGDTQVRAGSIYMGVGTIEAGALESENSCGLLGAGERNRGIGRDIDRSSLIDMDMVGTVIVETHTRPSSPETQTGPSSPALPHTLLQTDVRQNTRPHTQIHAHTRPLSAHVTAHEKPNRKDNHQAEMALYKLDPSIGAPTVFSPMASSVRDVKLRHATRMNESRHKYE